MLLEILAYAALSHFIVYYGKINSTPCTLLPRGIHCIIICLTYFNSLPSVCYLVGFLLVIFICVAQILIRSLGFFYFTLDLIVCTTNSVYLLTEQNLYIERIDVDNSVDYQSIFQLELSNIFVTLNASVMWP